MNKEDNKLDIKTLKTQVLDISKKVLRYKVAVFLLFIVLLYGFVWLRINSYNRAQPSTTEVSSQVKAAEILHIDQNVLNQLQTLQNNSVSVQTLFNQARSNPFN